MNLQERFLKYVSFDTQSDPNSDTYPSTKKQLNLLTYLKDELMSLGIETMMDQYGYVIGKIASNQKKKTPVLALIAHVDTSPDASGKDIKPRIIKAYDGDDIMLNDEQNIVLKTSVFPSLKEHIGHDLIVTDGTTLLGADDKLGVAEVMTIAEHLQKNAAVKHGEIVIVFTPDEEVGQGTTHLDVKKIGADFAYTLDGSKVGEIAYENFNAAQAKVTINGHSVHPGSAKNKMLNSIKLAYEFDQFLPSHMRPELTEGYEGFNHMVNIKGSCEKTLMTYIIRNHDRNIFESQKEDFLLASEFINRKYGDKTCILDIQDQYFNMNEVLKDQQHIVDIAIEAIKVHHIEPVIEPIRGGTDGARLTYLGLPCPNLGTGGFNFHGPYEYASLQEMDQAVEILKTIITKVSELD